jgi:hypothetical protein
MAHWHWQAYRLHRGEPGSLVGAVSAMRSTIASLQSQLGEDHPLARVFALRVVLLRDVTLLLALAAVLVPGVVLGWTVAPLIAGAALGVAAVLLAFAACLRLRGRELAAGLIVRGEDGCPVVAAERDRLMRSEYRQATRAHARTDSARCR